MRLSPLWLLLQPVLDSQPRDGAGQRRLGHVEAPNINKTVSMDTLFDVAAAPDVPPYKFLLFDE